MILRKNLYQPDLGEVDLLIRTGGEQRISNFLLWQIAYAELYFTDTQWPNFTRQELSNIIHEVEKRERRFGGLIEKEPFQSSSMQLRDRDFELGSGLHV